MQKTQIFMKRGFTLIELLVVVAIIGMLASIIVSATGTSRSKGIDGSVKYNLNQFRSQFDILALTTSGNYSTICSNSAMTKMLTNLQSIDVSASNAYNTTYSTTGAAQTITCHATTTAWGVEAPLSTGQFWCIDSSGKAATTSASTLASNDAACL
ncbi:MAG: putative Type pilus pilin [Candidatus Kaiserbacteria bacterium]|nr:putative Type pilus pilin [Candidatus Kaiserbacteria bacterium]